MRAKLIPAVNAELFDDVIRSIRRAETFSRESGIDRIHIDIADGAFTENTIWHQAEELAGFETPLELEVHLMLADIDRRVEEWLTLPVSTIIFHVEAARDPLFIVDACHKAGKRAYAALRPETPIEMSRAMWGVADGIQLLAVIPGRAGQAMMAGTPEKIATLRAACPSCIIEVDGGVTVANARSLIGAGANELVAASAIFGAPDPARAVSDFIKELT